jgi:hypothetical protein
MFLSQTLGAGVWANKVGHEKRNIISKSSGSGLNIKKAIVDHMANNVQFTNINSI